MWPEKIDIIPDSFAEVGYADDSLIVRTVLDRHRTFSNDYCFFRKIPEEKISGDP
jgi:uncharacterized membrane protein YkvA (DUF1232 family)